jgi:cell division GTPase FtsZ
VCATTAGGTGSGSVGVIVDLLKEEFKKPIYALLVLPFQNQYDEPDSVINTATCLKKVLDNSKADAVFLADNQKFVRKNESMRVNFSLINRRIADSFMDILCMGEETDRRYIGEVLDANDVIRILKRPSALGVSHAAVPPQKSSGTFLGLFKNGSDNGRARHFSISKAQIERAQNVVHSALAELSIDCEYVEDGRILYDAQNVLGLFSGPAHEATEEIVEMMDNTFAERVPGAGRARALTPDALPIPSALRCCCPTWARVRPWTKSSGFIKEATQMMGNSRDKRVNREQRWDDVARAAELLPNL